MKSSTKNPTNQKLTLRESLITKLLTLPDEISRVSNQLLNVTTAQEDVEEKMTFLEGETWAHVSETEDGNGKPRYSNDKLRLQRQREILLGHEQYQEWKARRKAILHDLAVLEAELALRHHQFQAAKSLVQLVGEER